MMETLKKWQEKIDSRVIRERALIFLVGLSVVFMLWTLLIQSHADKTRQEVEGQLANVATQRTNLQTQITTVTQALMNDPDKSKKDQVVQLQTDIQGVQKELQSVSQSLIRADQLPLALQEVLQKTSQLTLLEVNTLPARELQLAADGEKKPTDDKATDEAKSAGVYEHAVELRVSGSFTQVTQFLQALEQLPWRFYWQSLDYKVKQYPNAEILLRVYTLSAEEGLLGV